MNEREFSVKENTLEPKQPEGLGEKTIKEKIKQIEDERRARLFQELRAREIQDFEGSDSSEEDFLENQRK